MKEIDFEITTKSIEVYILARDLLLPTKHDLIDKGDNPFLNIFDPYKGLLEEAVPNGPFRLKARLRFPNDEKKYAEVSKELEKFKEFSITFNLKKIECNHSVGGNLPCVVISNDQKGVI